MLYLDHHVHTIYSPDSEGQIHCYLKDAKKMGLGRVLFTDHQDFGNPNPIFSDAVDYKKYFAVMEEQAKTWRIPIDVGVEIGYEPSHRKEIKDFLGQYPFEFVIASIHYGDGKCFYAGDFFHGLAQEQAYELYFELVLEMVTNFHDYDVAGHLDYIVRYGPYERKFYEYKRFAGIIDRILIEIIKAGKGLEVNTSGLREGLGTRFPRDEVLVRYLELGGRIVTIGSDCHSNEHFQQDVNSALQHLKRLGFPKVARFKERNPQAKLL